MVRKGEIIYNPVSGETFIFLQTSADTNSRLLQIDVTVNPGGNQFPNFYQIQPHQKKTMRVKSGKLKIIFNGKEHYFGAGETVVIPAGTPHYWANASHHEELNFIKELTPALHTECILEIFAALAQAGRLDRKGSVPFLQLALTFNKYPNHYQLASWPLVLQKLIFPLVSPVAFLLGYTAELNYKELVAGKDRPVMTHS